MLSKKQLSLACGVLIVLLLILGTLLSYTHPKVIIKSNYSKPIDLQLFYDQGNGLNEIDTMTQTIKTPNQTVRFRLPDEDVLTLRIDFGQKPEKIVIESITIKHISKTIRLEGQAIKEAFDTKNQLSRESVEDGKYIIVSNMLDPYIMNTNGELGINAGAQTWRVFQKLLLRAIIIVTLILIYALLLLRFATKKIKSQQKILLTLLIVELIRSIKSNTAKNRITIILISIILGLFINIATGSLDFTNVINSVISIADILLGIILNIIAIVFLLNTRMEVHLQHIKKREWIVYSSIIFLVLIILFIAYYPGAMTSDSINQWKQVTSGSYNDWHPVAHTIVFMFLPSLIWQNPASATLMQIIFISMVVGYVAYSLRCWGVSKKIVAVFLLLYIIHPSNQRIAVVLWKDVPYSFSLLVFSIMCMWIYFTEGRWIKNKKRLIAFCAVGLGVLFMRHNGVLAFIPSIICLVVIYRHQRKIFAIIGLALFIFKLVLTGPIYDMMGVFKFHQSFAEAMGVPNNQIAHIIYNDGKISDEQMEYLNEIAPIEQWKANYYPNSIDVLKWAADEDGKLYMNPNVIEGDKAKYLSTWASLVYKNFGLSLESYYYVTQVIWDFQVRYDGVERTVDNEEIRPQEIVQLKEKIHDKTYSYITLCENTLLKGITPSVGLAFFLMTLAIGCSMTKDKKKIIPYVPLLAHTLGMMCLISCDVVRYTYINILAYYPVIIFSLLDIKKCNQNKDIKREKEKKNA